MKTWKKILLAVLAVALLIFVITSMVNSSNQGKQIADLQAQLKATPVSIIESTVAPTATPEATATAAPTTTPTTEPTTTPEPTVSPETAINLGQIFINGKEVAAIDQGDRLYWSAGWQLFDHAPPYSEKEMAKIEKTWFNLKVVSSTEAAATSYFGYSIKLDSEMYTPGALFLLSKGEKTVESKKVNNFEVVIWKDYDTMMAEVEGRIVTEIQNGNLSIKRPLAFKYCSQEFVSFVPKELIEARKVKSVSITK